jgi:hypothetical protein
MSIAEPARIAMMRLLREIGEPVSYRSLFRMLIDRDLIDMSAGDDIEQLNKQVYAALHYEVNKPAGEKRLERVRKTTDFQLTLEGERFLQKLDSSKLNRQQHNYAAGTPVSDFEDVASLKEEIAKLRLQVAQLFKQLDVTHDVIRDLRERERELHEREQRKRA